MQVRHSKYSVPTATSQNTPQLSINGTTYKIRAGVSPTLPRYVLLGLDFGNLVGLAVREANAFSVLTLLQKRKQEREDTIVLAREISRGAKPKALEEIDGTVNGTCDEKEDDAIEFCDLDDSLFEGATKKRKTRKDKRTARKDWRQRTYIGVDAVSSSETSKQGRLPKKQPEDPERLHQGVGDSPSAVDKSSIGESETDDVTATNMSPDKLRELQQTDPS